MIIQQLLQIITNPDTRMLSASRAALFGAFIVSSAVLLWYAWFFKMDEWLFFSYMAAWVTQSQVARHSDVKRTRKKDQSEVKNG